MRIAIRLFANLMILFLLASCSKLNDLKPAPTPNPISSIHKDLITQSNCGPRLPGSSCHTEVEKYIFTVLEQNQWQVEKQIFTVNGIQGTNIIGKFGVGEQPIILGAHYDTRFIADQDPDPVERTQPVPGANDGASGVAGLLQLARSIPVSIPKNSSSIWLVFFDLEDNGNYQGWDWIVGSTAFVNQLTIKPKAAIIIDMIGDKDLNIYYELNSDKNIREQIWNVAADLGYQNIFISTVKYNMLDDHTPFLLKGIPAVDIIDFDYPYWHTSEDTLDKISAENILIISQTLLEWLKER